MSAILIYGKYLQGILKVLQFIKMVASGSLIVHGLFIHEFLARVQVPGISFSHWVGTEFNKTVVG